MTRIQSSVAALTKFSNIIKERFNLNVSFGDLEGTQEAEIDKSNKTRAKLSNALYILIVLLLISLIITIISVGVGLLYQAEHTVWSVLEPLLGEVALLPIAYKLCKSLPGIVKTSKETFKQIQGLVNRRSE